jgi:hypothetical protein
LAPAVIIPARTAKRSTKEPLLTKSEFGMGHSCFSDQQHRSGSLPVKAEISVGLHDRQCECVREGRKFAVKMELAVTGLSPQLFILECI